MAQTTLRQRIIGNPGQRKKSTGRSRRRRNTGEILGFVLGPAGINPGRKRGNMAKAKQNRARTNRSKSNPGHRRRRRLTASGHHAHRHHVRGRRRNPGRVSKKMNYGRRRRRNPGLGGDIGPMFTNAVFVIVGALGSKLGAQAILGTNNVGVVGYAGNAATGAVLWFLAEKVMKNRAAANGIIAGTLVQILLRVINDYTPFGSYVANLGMGDYQMQSFVTPQVLVDPWRNADIQIPNGWGAARPAGAMSASAGPAQTSGGRRQIAGAAGAPAAAPVAAGVSGYGGNLYGGNMSGLYG